jgi:hypothetical protein
MAAVNETIVREYLELHELLVRQYRKHVAPAGREDDDIDFFVYNPQPRPPAGDLPFVLGSADMPFIRRAIVVIKAWHSEVFSPALLSHAPELFKFLEKRIFQQAVREFGKEGGLLKILVVPALPQDNPARDQSIGILRSKGIDAVISYRTMLAELVSRVEPNRNYQKSDLLQLIRILKNYDFFKEPQMELFRAKPRRKKAAIAKAVEAVNRQDSANSDGAK